MRTSEKELKVGSPEFQDTHIHTMIREALETGFKEDLGFGDLTAKTSFAKSHQSGRFIAKKPGVLAGLGAITGGYGLLDSRVDISLHKNDGDLVEPGDAIADVEGPSGVLLSGERVILNLVQHLSGIATMTRKTVEVLEDPDIRICDTRKTLPGLRALQKYAVRCGGGYNHRFRLDDGVMVKDNHIAAAGGIRKAVEEIRDQVGLMVKIEVECESSEEVSEAVDAGADIIMLDNKSPDEIRSLRKQIPDSVIVEVSGGITLDTVSSYRGCGADYISLGSLTHSVKALDISFNLKSGKKWHSSV